MLNNHTTASFFISNIPIYGKVILAPMDGYTDLPMRKLFRGYGTSICFSEFINGIDIQNGHPHLGKKIAFDESERPFAYQIFDDDPNRLLSGAKFLRDKNPNFIDVNMGCSAKNVSNRGAGAGLLKDPQKIGRIIENLVMNIDLPITAKIRLGWDEETKNYLEVSKILQESGASMITVHARTKKQEYSGAADWSTIKQIKDNVSIPVIGNGDVLNLTDAQAMISQTNCDGVMIGRAAIGNPWIFQGKDKKLVNPSELFSTIRLHIGNMVAHYGERIGILMFRKHLIRYLSDYLISSEIRRELFSILNQNELEVYISKLLNIV